MLRLCDIGVNLTDPVFTGLYRGRQMHPSDIDMVIERARAAACHCLIITAGNAQESARAISMAMELNKREIGRNPRITACCTVGCHPTRCSEFERDPVSYTEQLRALVAKHRVMGTPGSAHQSDRVVVAIGECGLDYDRTEFCPAEIQRKFFPVHFQLAREFGLPMFLHCRNTGNDFFEIVNAHMSYFRSSGGPNSGGIPGGVVHSFTGNWEEASRLLGLGLHIGVNGCSLKTEENLAVVKRIPVNRIMIETDAPWCDIRQTHASFKLLPRVGELPQDALPAMRALCSIRSIPQCRAEKFVVGQRVKSRNEPANLIEVLHVLFALHKDDVPSAEALADLIYRSTISIFPVPFA